MNDTLSARAVYTLMAAFQIAFMQCGLTLVLMLRTVGASAQVLSVIKPKSMCRMVQFIRPLMHGKHTGVGMRMMMIMTTMMMQSAAHLWMEQLPAL